MKSFSEATKREFIDIVRHYYDGDMTLSDISDSGEMWDFVRIHQMSAIFCHVLINSGVAIPYDMASVRSAYLMGIQLNMTIGKESDKLSSYLDEAGIPHGYIKGQYLKRLYNPVGVRSMGDADIFVPESHMDAVNSYMREHGYSETEYYGGVHSYVRDKVMFEVHNEISWFGIDWATRCTLTANGYSDEDEALLTILHTLKHIAGMGCGVRQVLDTALILREQSDILTSDRLMEALAETHMTACYEALIGVINRWFGTSYPCHAESRAVDILAMSILDGGVFGKNINDYATVNTVKNKSRLRMYMRMLFPTYERMALAYPRLRRQKWLIGYYYIKRLITKGLGSKKYKYIHTEGANDGSVENRRIYVEILQLEDSYYNKLK